MTTLDPGGNSAIVNNSARLEDSLTYLLKRVGLAEERVRALVNQRRAGDPAPDDPFLGLYLSDDAAARLLARPDRLPALDMERRNIVETWAAAAEASGARLRLRTLACVGGLTSDDVELLVMCLLPDLDSRFERLYGYLNDDVTRRRATIGLALALAGLEPVSAAARARLSAGAPLIDLALVLAEDGERPFLTRGLRVPDRVTAHLLGGEVPDETIAGLLAQPYGHDTVQAADIARAITAGQKLVYVREMTGSAGGALAVAALRRAGYDVLSVDGARLLPVSRDVVTVLGREALLRAGGLVVGPIDALAAPGERGAGVLAGLAALPVPVILAGTVTWDPEWSERVPLQIQAQRMTTSERTELWRSAFGSEDVQKPELLDDIAGQFAFGPGQVARALGAARASAAVGDNAGATGAQPLSAAELRRGARSQNAAGLERLARRIEPGVDWDDLVLPSATLNQLRELTDRARQRDRVLLDWRMRPGGGRGHGITALFAGDSGTGKTMAAEVIAGELGLDLYTVNLAAVVDKYIGETEKNLERIFTEAGGVNAVLLFDEADAIFGKRSEVRDAHDRYANIESAYLLQRMETFEGLALLATNLRANLDEAFSRRLDTVIDFPAPEADSRLALWQRCLRPPVPCAANLDLAFVAKTFELSGGNIRSAAVTAAYLAAASGGEVGMAEVVAAVRQEYRKLGRLMLDREFGGRPAADS